MIETCPNHPQLTVGLQHCTRCGRSYCPDCLVSFRGGLYDAACKDAQLRDFAAGHSALKIASPWSRLGAAWIDGFVLIIPIGAIYYVSFLLSDMPFGAFIQSPLARWGTAGVISIVYILYDGILIARRGATVGKSAAGLRVVNPDGSPVGAGGAWGRAASKYFFNYTQFLGIIDLLMIFTNQRRTLHDRVAKTLVVEASSIAPR